MPELAVAPLRDARLVGAPDWLQAGNFGNTLELRNIIAYAGSDKTIWERVIVDFDVSQLAGTTRLAAKLVREITELTNGGHQAKISRCTRPGDWVESEVTWIRYKAGADWTTVGGDFDDTGPPAALTYTEPTATGQHDVPGLLAFVEDAIENRGGIVSLVARLANELPAVDTAATWYSRNQPQLGWRLVVEYAPPDAGRRSLRRSSRRRSLTPERPARPMRPAQQRATIQPHRPPRRQT